MSELYKYQIYNFKIISQFQNRQRSEDTIHISVGLPSNGVMLNKPALARWISGDLLYPIHRLAVLLCLRIPIIRLPDYVAADVLV